jgi:hypothetical protein
MYPPAPGQVPPGAGIDLGIWAKAAVPNPRIAAAANHASRRIALSSPFGSARTCLSAIWRGTGTGTTPVPVR